MTNNGALARITATQQHRGSPLAIPHRRTVQKDALISWEATDVLREFFERRGDRFKCMHLASLTSQIREEHRKIADVRADINHDVALLDDREIEIFLDRSPMKCLQHEEIDPGHFR